MTGGSMSTTFKSSDHDFPKLYEGSELRRQNEARMEELAEQGRTTSEPLALSGTYATSKSMQSKMLIRKFFHALLAQVSVGVGVGECGVGQPAPP